MIICKLTVYSLADFDDYYLPNFIIENILLNVYFCFRERNIPHIGTQIIGIQILITFMSTDREKILLYNTLFISWNV